MLRLWQLMLWLLGCHADEATLQNPSRKLEDFAVPDNCDEPEVPPFGNDIDYREALRQAWEQAMNTDDAVLLTFDSSGKFERIEGKTWPDEEHGLAIRGDYPGMIKTRCVSSRQQQPSKRLESTGGRFFEHREDDLDVGMLLSLLAAELEKNTVVHYAVFAEDHLTQLPEPPEVKALYADARRADG